MAKREDLTGMTFGKMTVLRHEGRAKDRSSLYLCRCECGTEKVVMATHLKSGSTQSCGCLRGHSLELQGKTFGRLTVTQRTAKRKWALVWWQCLCECGNTIEVPSRSLVSGNTRSCGCLRQEINKERAIDRNTTHGQTESPTHNIWLGMRRRCYTPSDGQYHNYGGRGIDICSRWRDSFEAFLEDMGERPDGLEIDRIDNDKGYWCGKCDECRIQNNQAVCNCRWTTRGVNMNNTRSNRRLTLNGESRTISEWSRLTGISISTICARKKNGWSDERTLTTPVKAK